MRPSRRDGAARDPVLREALFQSSVLSTRVVAPPATITSATVVVFSPSTIVRVYFPGGTFGNENSPLRSLIAVAPI